MMMCYDLLNLQKLWYATAVNWAAASGITSGTGDGNFSPNTAITREQLAAILMNYAQYKGQDVSARATLDTYNDATAISSLQRFLCK